MNREQYAAQAKGIYQQGLENVKKNPEPTEQKFPVGSFVWIAKELGSSMSHFRGGCVARVQYTYAHAYGHLTSSPDKYKSYSLLVSQEDGDWSSSAWYEEWQLSTIKDEDILKRLEEIFKEGTYEN